MKNFKYFTVLVLSLVLGLFLTSCNGVPTHTHKIITHDAVEVTCTTDGVIKYYECETCNRLYSDEAFENQIELEDTIIPAIGHKMTEHAAVEETCTTDGNVAHFACENCNKYFEDAEGLVELEIVVIPALGHAMTEHERVEATCTEAGNVHYYECGTCNKYFEDAEGNVELKDVVIPALGHSMAEHERVEPTCTTDGNVHYYECSTCEKYFEDAEGKVELKDVVIPALGHAMTEHERVEATCTTAGNVHYYECGTCNKYFEDAEGKVELKDVVIPALGHAMTEYAAVEATCTEDGNVHYYACANCKKYFEDAEGKVELKDVVIPALGHAMTEHAAVEAGCGVAGNVHYYECANCNKYFEDEAGKVELKEVVIPGLEHNIVTHEAVAPQVGVAGNVEYYECTNCHKLYLDAEGQEETTAEAVVVHLYVVSSVDAKTPGYYVDYRDSLTFKDVEGNGSFVSENKGMNSSSSYMDIFFTATGVFNVTYTVSSESNWDKFNVYAKSDGEGHRNIVYNASGEVSATLTLNVEAGDYIYFSYSKDSGGNRGSDCVVLSNITFVTNEYYEKSVLSFESNGGSQVEAISTYQNVAINAPAQPVKDGFFFDGWFEDESCTKEFDFAKGINGSITVYAKYTEGVTVSYANTGDTEVEAQLVRPNAAIVAPEVTPVSATQYFKGWYADAECTIPFDFAVGVAEDTVVYAGWRNPVVLSFDSKEGSAVENINTDINVAIILPAAPVKDGFFFDGWYVDESYETEFNAEAGITVDTTVYAKWLVVYTVTYMNGDVTLATVDVVEGTAYNVVMPEGFTEIVEGWFVDANFENEYVDGTVVNQDVVLYAKVKSIAPAGVLSSMNNGASGSYEWIFDVEAGTFVSGNKGVSSSKSIIEFTYAKDSFTSFDYLVNSESNYDYLTIYVNDSSVVTSKRSGSNGVDITGSFTYTFKAGDVLKVEYRKDSSGNQGDDHVVLSNFVINDGVPSVTVTLNYNEEGVEDVVVNGELNAVISTMEALTTNAPAETDARHFGGWYYDAECTQAVGETDALLTSIVLYAKYLYPATISFETDGADPIEAINVWTGVAIENMPENPSKPGYIFRYWLDENADEFVPANGVTGSCTLYAYFEELPVGSTKEEALEIQLENGAFVSNTLTTNEEFQDFYAVFTPSVTDYYYFKFDSANVSVVGGTVSSISYRRYTIQDVDGNTVLSKTSDDSRVELEAGVTYYVIYNLAYSSYKAWGTFKAEVYQYNNDYAPTEAIAYEFGTTVALPGGTFKARAHTLVYEYECATSGVYALKLSSNAWANVKVYSDVELTNQVAYKNCSSTTVVVDLPAEAGNTYYIVLSHNWTSTELTTKTMTFAVTEYAQGYSVANPFAYTLGEVINPEFTNGQNAYYQVEVTEAGTYKLDILSISDSNSKTIEVYTADMQTKVATLAGTAACEYYIESLEAGTYIIKAFNTSSNYNTSFTASLVKVAEGAYWTTAETLELSASMTLEAAGTHYYQFTTTDKLWHFFTAQGGTVEVYGADRKSVGAYGVQLAENTTYFLVVNGEGESVTVDFNTLVEYADGKSPAGAFTYNESTANLSLVQANYTTYFKITVAESGTYRIYTNNNGSIDTRGYLYDSVDCSNQLKYNDDAGSSNTYVGYRYDFYFECALEAGTEYYLKVTYNVYSSNTATSLTLNVEKAA